MKAKEVSDYLDKLEEFEKLKEEMLYTSSSFTNDEWKVVLSPPDSYQPYNGLSGPTPEQVHNNNVAIMNVIKTMGFECVCIVPESEFIDTGDDDYDVVVFRIEGNMHDIAYERWGYYSDSLDLEQATWNQTIDCLLGLHKI